MKWLIILLLLLVLAAVIAWQYRRQLMTAWFMYQAFRKMRKRMKPPAQDKQVEPKSRSGDTELVRCPKCQKWMAKEDAVKLKSDYFCSLACLEESVTFNR
jgi:hypothetical protein